MYIIKLNNKFNNIKHKLKIKKIKLKIKHYFLKSLKKLFNM